MLSTLALTALVAVAPASLPAGSYTYTASLDGTPTGTSSLTVSRDGELTHIDEKASGTANGMDFAGTATLVLGADLAPTHYDGSYKLAGQDASVSAALTPTTATVKSSATGGQPQTFSLGTAASHFVVIEPGLVAGFLALPAQMQAWNGGAVSAIAPAFGREVPIVPQPPAGPLAPPAGVPAQDAALSIGGHLPFTIWYDPATLIPDEIVVPSQNATVTRVRG